MFLFTCIIALIEIGRYSNDPPSCYKLEGTIRPLPILQSQFNNAMVNLGRSGVFISEVEELGHGLLKPGILGETLTRELVVTFTFENDHINNFLTPMKMESLVERSQVGLVYEVIKSIGAANIPWEPMSNALVIRRGIEENGISDVRIYSGGKFDLKYDMRLLDRTLT
jgi:hypothetical protein